MKTKIRESNETDIVFDPYFENSIRELERCCCLTDTKQVKFVNLLLGLTPPVDLY